MSRDICEDSVPVSRIGSGLLCDISSPPWSSGWVGQRSELRDAHKGYEESLVPRLRRLVNRIHVLKVTHHGSSSGTSPNLTQALRPAIAFASTDAHPMHRLEDDVRERLGDAAIYTTHDPSRPVHKEKDIVIRTDGQQRLIDGTQGVMFEVWRREPALRPLLSVG